MPSLRGRDVRIQMVLCLSELLFRDGKMKGTNLEEKNGMWKGNNVGIPALHDWIKSRLIKPEFCQKCNQNKVYDLTNKSGLYKRDFNDWEWLCRKCHMESDGRMKNLKRNPKLSIEEKKKKLKINHHKYYIKNKEKILKDSKIKWQIYYSKNKEKYLEKRKLER